MFRKFLQPQKKEGDLPGLIALLIFAAIAVYFLHGQISDLFAGL